MMMDATVWVRLGLLLVPLRRWPLAHCPRRAILALALLLSLAPWLLASRWPAAAAVSSFTLSLPAGPPLVGVATDPAFGRAFLADAGGTVWALDERSGRWLGAAAVTTIQTGAPSGAMAVDPTRHRVYLGALAGGLALDGRTGVPGPPWTTEPTLGLAFDSVADRVLVPRPREHALAAFDAGSGRAGATVTLAGPVGALAVDAPARRVYVAAADVARLDVFDADDYRPLASAALPGPAAALAVDAALHRVYAADPASGAISVIDGRSGANLATLHVGPAPVALALNPATGHLFVAGAGAVVMVDTRRNAIVTTVPAPGQPAALALDSQTGLVYVADGSAGAAPTPSSGRTVTVLRDPGRPLALLAAFGVELGRS